ARVDWRAGMLRGRRDGRRMNVDLKPSIRWGPTMPAPATESPLGRSAKARGRHVQWRSYRSRLLFQPAHPQGSCFDGSLGAAVQTSRKIDANEPYPHNHTASRGLPRKVAGSKMSSP